jgi:transketolase
MRDGFIEKLEKIAVLHDDLFLLTADLGFRLFDGFQANHPGRFIDVGIAESNMAGIAAGLALSGRKVYCYSIIPFLVMRGYEQIRVDIAFHNLNVRLVGVGGGFTYGLEGFTHFALEDLALMRALPNMTVVIPSDRAQAEALAEASYEHEGPMYIRLGRTDNTIG